MDSIFFEKQEGQLCAQHCLNSLLQGPIFTAVDLAGYARQLDEEEQATMAEGGFTNPEFLRFMQQPSSNMDDSGFFSVQVIAKALSMWNLELESLTSPQMKRALDDPTTQKAFICNHDSHWLTVRKLGQQWFNLNSLLKRPELISDTYLSLFLHQLQLEGYSIFVVIGTLPPCEADQVLSLVRAEAPPLSPARHSSSRHTAHPKHSPRESGEQPRHSGSSKRHNAEQPSGSARFLKLRHFSGVKGASVGREEQDLQMAMAMSASLEQEQEQFEIDQQLQIQQLQEEKGKDPAFRDDNEVSGDYGEEEDDAAITAAIYASLEDEQRDREGSAEVTQTHGYTTTNPTVLREEDTSEREEEETVKTKVVSSHEDSGYDEGDTEFTAAQTTVPPLPQEELRMRRLKHLEQLHQLK